MSGDPICRTRWESENVVKVHVKINRNQDPDLYRILSQSESKSGTARQLMQLGLKAMTADLGEEATR